MNLDKKLEMAQEYAISHIKNANSKLNTSDLLVRFSWDYADAMEAEYNKRKKEEVESGIQYDEDHF